MIKHVTGDILKSKCQAIAHGVAPNDDCKNGLALSLRENWPAMYKDFRHICQTTHPKIGTLWTWGGTGGTRIVSLFTQDGGEGHQAAHGGKATLSNVAHCLKALRKEVEKEGYTSLALPRLATGVGGLDWKDVEPLINEHLSTLKIPIVIYDKFNAGVAAEEGL
jgi:O-acetyl-ADP-ribose deacetylase (regulator of RNase III)